MAVVDCLHGDALVSRECQSGSSQLGKDDFVQISQSASVRLRSLVEVTALAT